jgi:hypothetical protein
MERLDIRNVAAFVAAAILLAPSTTVAFAENIDPAADGSQYAWAENVGWVNLEPLGDGGPGVQVDDFELTGWMWSENTGWISLSCKTTGSCGTAAYGVSNDGAGNLAGFGWSENTGWVNFAPRGGGVVIDPATGEFDGQAWSENVGWISFSSAGATTFEIVTEWRCDPAPAAPTVAPLLRLTKRFGATRLEWAPTTDASAYDVVRGDLWTLLHSAGDFAAATHECLADGLTQTWLRHPGRPAPGQAWWYLVRGVNCGGPGTYDVPAGSLHASRDAGVAAAGYDCP